MNIYSLYRNFWDWCFENPELIKPNHIALYSFSIEHCNRLGWKKKFGLPTTMAKEAIGIKSYTTYIKTLNDLIDWGFIKMLERSKNQYSANIIALSNFDKALDKALDKAMIKHVSKQSESTCESIVSIDKQIYNNTNIPLTIEKNDNDSLFNFDDLRLKYLQNDKIVKAVCNNQSNNITENEIEKRLTDFNTWLTESGEGLKTFKDYCKHFLSWHKKNKIFKAPQSGVKRNFL